MPKEPLAVDQHVRFDEEESIFLKMEHFRQEIENLARDLGAPTTVSIGLASGLTSGDNIKPRTSHRKTDFAADPVRYRAHKAILRAKKQGGNCIVRE